MYISDKREKIKIPDKYAGNAFSDKGYESDPEALRTAEEAFMRGYVFDEQKLPGPPLEEAPVADAQTAETEKTDTDVGVPFEEAAVSASARVNEMSPKSERSGRLSELIKLLTSENVILIGLILVLWNREADDELLIMLIILLFC